MMNDVKDDVFGITKGRRFFEKLIWFVIAIICVIAVFFLMDKYVKDRTETVDIIRVSNQGINQNLLIEERDIERYAIIKKEFNEKTMFKWEDKEKVIHSYATYYLKENTPIYKDAIYGEKRYRNEWMYDIDASKEVLTVPFDYRVTGGNILIPGDRVKIRVYYEGAIDVFAQKSSEESKIENTETQTIEPEGTSSDGLWGDYFGSTNSNDNVSFQSNDTDGEAIQVNTIFEDIEVIDMLANGESIYEKYLELKDMSEEERRTKLQSSEFAKTIIPDSMILVVDPEQANRYLQALAIDAQLVITILPREMNETILDKVELIEDLTEEIQQAANAVDAEGDE